jgi:hypothetical protein
MAIPDHFHIVQAVHSSHPHLIATNSRETVTEFLWRAATALAEHDPNWGFLSKSPGENGTEIPGVGRVAIDALAYRNEHPSVDIVGSAGDGPGRGSITWGIDEHRRVSNSWVPVVPFGGGPAPQPLPLPASDDLRRLIAELTLRVQVAEAKAVDAKHVAEGAYMRAGTTSEALGLLAERINKGLRVEGSSGRSFGHSHSVNLRVVG